MKKKKQWEIAIRNMAKQIKIIYLTEPIKLGKTEQSINRNSCFNAIHAHIIPTSSKNVIALLWHNIAVNKMSSFFSLYFPLHHSIQHVLGR